MNKITVLAACGCLVLAACSSPAERAAAAEKVERADSAECQRLGFKESTENFGNCILKLREIRAQEKAALRAPYDDFYPRFGIGYTRF
jgi:hypothetical protein